MLFRIPYRHSGECPSFSKQLLGLTQKGVRVQDLEGAVRTRCRLGKIDQRPCQVHRSPQLAATTTPTSSRRRHQPMTNLICAVFNLPSLSCAYDRCVPGATRTTRRVWKQSHRGRLRLTDRMTDGAQPSPSPLRLISPNMKAMSANNKSCSSALSTSSRTNCWGHTQLALFCSGNRLWQAPSSLTRLLRLQVLLNAKARNSSSLTHKS